MNMMSVPLRAQSHDYAFDFWSAATPNNELRVLSFAASEQAFGLTEIEIELVSRDPDIDLQGLIDEPATLAIRHKYQADPRYFSGVIATAERGERGRHRTIYHVTILPTLHRLQYGSDSKIFQQKSVPDIVKEVFGEYGVTDTKWTLACNHLSREYCVQYRETHLEFIERLLAEEGIWYFFTYGADGAHTLNLIDLMSAVPEAANQAKLVHNSMGSGVVKDVYCNQFRFREQVRSSYMEQRDYTFKKPAYNQKHEHSAQEVNGLKGDYKLYDYPGRYKESGVGQPFTAARLERARVDASSGRGTTNAIHLMAGHSFELSDHDVGFYNTKYFTLSMSMHGSQPGSMEEEAGDAPSTCNASFQVMPLRLPYRPPLGHKPMVDGPQMAHVVGPAGEEIYCDEYGRVKVQFPWDRYGKSDDKSSCWIRVSQNWAGGSWGHMAIPRIGQEVIVDFLEGDPDQPIITGRTYHETNKVPNELPKFKTRMILKSDSHKGEGFNELRFEDEAGQEEVWFHAQKFHNLVIGDDQNQHLKASRHKLVDKSQSENIKADKDIKVEGLHREAVTGSYSLTVDAERKSKIAADDDVSVGGAQTTQVSGAGSLSVGGNYAISVGAGSYQQIGTDYYVLSGANTHLQAGGTQYIWSGSGTVIESAKEICLTVGANCIKISKTGIEIEGTIVKLNCGAAPTGGTEVKPVGPASPKEPEAYAGPHTERYGRSFEK